MPDEPTYAALVAERRAEWQDAQRRVVLEHEALQAHLLTLPDIMPPESPWTTNDIVCGCGTRVFTVRRWVTISGRKHRAELACVACQKVGTWDWGTKAWLD